ncbi:COP23 domain-containing protein [Crocosphaera sp.]|uniref:COP23 domain-containing protein n=1 Tax=Crocosphaera sp. TaxID=2729996 RepID=UPI00263252B4|nr:COP23 domain-containing protein [Crocosphaera sp.]MDJ0578702.1 COP23 domain-containing protein [Crocosphaera sp.]
MKLPLIRLSTVVCLLINSSFFYLTPQAKAQERLRFTCASGRENNQTYPTTYAFKSHQLNDRVPIIYWKYDWVGNDTITPLERCRSVSRRFQEAANNESLNFITNSKVNGQPVICTARKIRGKCITVLLTLRNSDDPIQVLTHLKDRLRGRGGKVIRHSTNDNDYQIYYEIEIEKFLQS